MRDGKGFDKRQTTFLFSLLQTTLLMKLRKTSNNSLGFFMANNRLDCIFMVGI